MTRTTQWFLDWVYRPEVSSFEVRQSTSTQLEPGTKKDTGSEGFSRVVLRIIDLSFHVSVLLYECRVSPGYSDIILINDVLAISPPCFRLVMSCDHDHHETLTHQHVYCDPEFATVRMGGPSDMLYAGSGRRILWSFAALPAEP